MICSDLPIAKHENLLKSEHPRKKGGKIAACASFPVENFRFMESISSAGAFAIIGSHYDFVKMRQLGHLLY